MKRNYVQYATQFLKKNVYITLLGGLGAGALIEGNRLIHKYESNNWLSGPGGFIILMGYALLALFTFEAISRLVRHLRSGRIGSKTTSDVGNAAPVTDGQNDEHPVDQRRQNEANRNMILSFAMLALYTALIRWLGFVIASAFYLAGNLWLLKNSWKASLITVLAVTLFLLFGAPSLGISFPRGVFGF